MSRRTAVAVVLLLGALAVAGCASPASMMNGREGAIADRLYFGRAMPGGENVSEDDWRLFLAEIVTPGFPGGLTTWSADGQWRDSAGRIVREGTYILELVHPADAGADKKISEIIDEYKRRFRHESVMWMREDVRVRF